MFTFLRHLVGDALRYAPLDKTAEIRRIIDGVKNDSLPYCPPDEGDLLYALIRANGYRRCLETGFFTGSTALYMAAATADRDGEITSICVDPEERTALGLALLDKAGHRGRHRLVQANSNRALPELFLAGERFDLIFVDGWKTYDHLAFEIYLFNQMLETGGVIVFDDAVMPSVRKAIRLAVRHYGYREIDYGAYIRARRLRLFHILTRRSRHRPYRALVKTRDTEQQAPFADPYFFRRV